MAMDNAVALVQAYLRVNGFFTVTEFPVVEALDRGGFGAATDLDVLAFRFPHAGILRPRERKSDVHDEYFAQTDPALGIEEGTGEMIIGEVKEGRAEINKAASNAAVIRTALTRFGCCERQHIPQVVAELLRHGEARTHCHHRVRVLAFGSSAPDHHPHFTVILLSHIVSFLNGYLEEHWPALQACESKEPGLGMLMTLTKAGWLKKAPHA
jgi:hypothetical protein